VNNKQGTLRSGKASTIASANTSDTNLVIEGSFMVPEVIAKKLAEHIAEMIIFGEFAPGEHLVELEISAQFSVSRSPVREALRLLEEEGLVVKESRRGVRVTSIGIEDLDEVYSCRILLEALAAERAAQNRSQQDLLEIRRSIDALEAIKTSKQSNIRQFFRENQRLAVKVHAAARNQTLKRLLGSVGKQSHRYRYLAYSHIPEMMSASVDGHREILTAMEKRNAKRARAVMESMIERSWKAIRDHFQSDTPREVIRR